MTPENPRKRDQDQAIEHATDLEMERLRPASAAITSQLHQLAERVRAARGEDYGTDDEEVAPGFWIDPDDTGTIVVWITVNDRDHGVLFYGFGPDDSLVAWRLASGRSWWAVVHEDRTFGPWHDEAPPPWLAAGN
jgi:hypothetical protein